MMDAYRTIISKRDTREYEERPIEEEVLKRILQAGRMAGSSRNAQPIRLVVLRDPQRRAALARCGDYTAHLPASPLVIAITRVEGSRPFDAGRTAQNMMLAAWAHGVGSCPVGIQHDASAREALGLPENVIVAMALSFGYPKGGRAVSRGLPRLPLEEFVRWERW
jgi:nitroreductase